MSPAAVLSALPLFAVGLDTPAVQYGAVVALLVVFAIVRAVYR